LETASLYRGFLLKNWRVSPSSRELITEICVERYKVFEKGPLFVDSELINHTVQGETNKDTLPYHTHHLSSSLSE